MLRSEALKLMATLEANFLGGGDLSEEAKELRVQGLLGYPADVGHDAVRALIDLRENGFFPTWGEMRTAIELERKERRHRAEMERPELGEALVPPPPEFMEARRQLAVKVGVRLTDLRDGDPIDHDTQRLRVRRRLDEWDRDRGAAVA
jgi:Mg-chelatase subunit ChlI